MEKMTVPMLKETLKKGDITHAMPYLIEFTLEFGMDVPGEISEELDSTGADWRYYNIMVHYAVKWHQAGYSPSKLKKLMDEVIQLLKGKENDAGKRSATGMFMDYMQYKSQINSYLARMSREKSKIPS